MNSTIETIQNHRSIRFFKDQKVEEEKRSLLLETMNRAATSTGMQTASVIRITDGSIKQEIAKIANQPYINHVPELMIFVVDLYRNSQIAKAKGYTGEKYRSMDNFFQGVADAYIQAQTFTIAAESLGFGAVYFGSILNDSAKMIELLQLPSLTFPIVGLGYGYPNDNPELKPRIPVEYKVGENTYSAYSDYLELLKEYDTEMTQYYDTREKNQRSDSFTDQVKDKIESGKMLRSKMMQVVKTQGFDVMLEKEEMFEE
ncbi:NADPH-dependent oxidoreductase [Facklamia sp. DSM 111018]|uniref:NADPH-dependent oxidoreductase n=1 Tax=Facklamia lactis TaxID=2749967 RepID=A0ABS0LSI6_9LACT|nr:NADPH-dependent oxidoreductase [Facklamia lactis]MBG9981394.1 NADPH-dependent oxidoreductase [Facklamia lactis]MBG9987130.1 NADPH-dependent oxidoreductase [Facklamia lactis]